MNTRDGLQNVSYRNTGHIHKNQHGSANYMDTFPRVPNKEVVYMVSPNSELKCVKLRTDNNSVSWIIELVLMFNNSV